MMGDGDGHDGSDDGGLGKVAQFARLTEEAGHGGRGKVWGKRPLAEVAYIMLSCLLVASSSFRVEAVAVFFSVRDRRIA